MHKRNISCLYANRPSSITQLKWNRNEKVDLPESFTLPTQQPTTTTLIDTTRTIPEMGFCFLQADGPPALRNAMNISRNGGKLLQTHQEQRNCVHTALDRMAQELQQ